MNDFVSPLLLSVFGSGALGLFREWAFSTEQFYVLHTPKSAANE